MNRPRKLVRRRQEGFILPWTIMASMLGVFIVVPVVVLAGNALRGNAKIEDDTRSYYAAEAAVHAVIEDLIRGADGFPNPPFTYTAPSIDFGLEVPAVTIITTETELAATIKPVKYQVASNPTLLQGFSPSGGALELASDDNSYYKVTSSGEPPKVVWEVTSQVIQFPKVSFGDVNITALSTKSSTKLELFVFNPNDPLHTQSGYNPIPDGTFILEVANVEQTFSVSLESADLDYLHSLSTKSLKIKAQATRSGGFRLDTDRIVFSISGQVTTDQQKIQGQPTLATGSLLSGSGADLSQDDTSYYTVSSAGNVVQFEVTSDTFSFSFIDAISVPLIARSSKDGVTLEMYVFNPTDPAHTAAGYDPVPDLTTTIPVKNVDKSVTLSLAAADISYLNTLSPISLKLKIRATFTSSFQLEADFLSFIATSTTAPTTVTSQITQQYVDPGMKNPDFAQIATKQGYLLRIYNLRPGLLKVSWANHKPDLSAGDGSIQVYRGFVVDGLTVVPPGKITTKPKSTDNELLVAASSRPRDPFVQTDFLEVDRGLFTIVFFNDSSTTLITDAFAPNGSKENTWIYVPAFKDYVVDVQVGKVGLKAVVRQIPGPTEPPAFPWSRTNINWIENLVLIQSWEPYGVP